MGGAQSLSKLQASLYEVEGYYGNDSSSPLLKQAFQSEIEAESSNTVVMPVMTIDTNNWEEEMAVMKAILEKHTKRVKKRRHASSCRKKSLPN